jgi:hypothetical protein
MPRDPVECARRIARDSMQAYSTFFDVLAHEMAALFELPDVPLTPPESRAFGDVSRDADWWPAEGLTSIQAIRRLPRDEQAAAYEQFASTVEAQITRIDCARSHARAVIDRARAAATRSVPEGH